MCLIMSKPKISVILPVYNVEDYLTETLNSILNQSMIDDIEVIMVDDGSTDESRYIIERYALDYDNFHAYHKDNEGQAITRNFGLKLAQGDYIHFFDSDDFIPSKAYETLYDIALKNDSDIVSGNVQKFARYNVWEDNLFKNSFGDMTEVIGSTTLDQMPSLIWDTITCNKLYKREFLLKNNIEFPDKRIAFEDIPFSLKSYILSDRISITPEICYYWRLRSDNTSLTQQDLDVESMEDRLEILNMASRLLVEHDVNSDIANEEYLKWIDHDLKFFIKRFDHFPKERHRAIFDEIHELVKPMPSEIIESLNSYKRAVFEMVLNDDFDSFVSFAPLENDLFENPHVPDFLGEEYKGYFDFNEAIKDEELNADLTGVDWDESNIFIEYSGMINYLSGDLTYDVSADLVDDDKIHSLEVTDSRIAVPIDLIRNTDHSRIEVCYNFPDFKKQCTLKNRHRQSIDFDDFYLDLNIGINSNLFIDIMEKTDNPVEIEAITYENGEYVLKGTSKSHIDCVYMENVITFEKISCPAEYINENEFTFRICEWDIFDSAVKKWEINCTDSKNSLRVSKSFEFYDRYNKVRFINSRNKILIEDDLYHVYDELKAYDDLKSSYVPSLKSENDMLKEEIDQLNDRIEEFKSRKAVRIADKLNMN